MLDKKKIPAGGKKIKKRKLKKRFHCFYQIAVTEFGRSVKTSVQKALERAEEQIYRYEDGTPCSVFIHMEGFSISKIMARIKSLICPITCSYHGRVNLIRHMFHSSTAFK